MTDQDKKEQHTLYFYKAFLSEAVFECLLEEWKNIETDKRKALKKEQELDTDSENEENKMRILQEWKNSLENDRVAKEQQTKTGLVITKIYQQKIAENPFKHAEGYVYQNLEEQNAKDKPKKKREIRREEKRRLTRAREEEKMIKKQFEVIDTKMENYSREVRIQWKKELKREQMRKMTCRRKLEKEMKTKKEEKEKVQIKMLINDIRNIYILDILCPDDIDMEKKEEEKEESKETQTNINVKIDDQREEKKKTVTERIRSFFMSLCCIKGQ
ncbi:trichohyalin-like isoform X2 [Mytilus trossulus]|uniref:trichohyalin-like isoform X2 n=1 Tax=Mytilus trossulus TaxID=6551 RepID=UPI00300603FF